MSLDVAVVKKDKGIFTVLSTGSIDSDTYSILEEKLASCVLPSAKVVVFDMKDVSYISSIGVGTIFKTKKKLEENNGTIVLTNLQPQIKKVFDIINALPAETIVESVEELDEYLAQMQRQEIEKEASG